MLGPEANHLRHGLPSGELPLAGVELRRPDPAARRRPADDRRRLPRPRSGDDDARLPPGAGRRLGRGDDRGGDAGDRDAARRARSSTSTQWMRRLAMRIAMRALLGLDPDEAGPRGRRRRAFRAGARVLRDRLRPALPARPGLALAEDARLERRSSTRSSSPRSPTAGRRPDPGRLDVLSLLLDVRDEAGERFSDREVRDQLMTLMFAGHDTSTSTLTFMMYELARRPDVIEKLQEEQDACSAGRCPTSSSSSASMPYLDQVLDEVLRLYPPAWIGPRRAVREFEFNGHTVPRRGLPELLLVGEPPDPRVLPRARGLPARALREGAQGGAAPRRLRPLRRRQADLHRQALRPDRGEAGRDDAAPAAAPRPAAGPHDDRPPDADALAPRRPEDAGPPPGGVARPRRPGPT